jgi:hypothetical protein
MTPALFLFNFLLVHVRSWLHNSTVYKGTIHRSLLKGVEAQDAVGAAANADKLTYSSR